MIVRAWFASLMIACAAHAAGTIHSGGGMFAAADLVRIGRAAAAAIASARAIPGVASPGAVAAALSRSLDAVDASLSRESIAFVSRGRVRRSRFTLAEFESRPQDRRRMTLDELLEQSGRPDPALAGALSRWLDREFPLAAFTALRKGVYETNSEDPCGLELVEADPAANQLSFRISDNWAYPVGCAERGRVIRLRCSEEGACRGEGARIRPLGTNSFLFDSERAAIAPKRFDLSARDLTDSSVFSTAVRSLTADDCSIGPSRSRATHAPPPATPRAFRSRRRRSFGATAILAARSRFTKAVRGACKRTRRRIRASFGRVFRRGENTSEVAARPATDSATQATD